jgi:hypothetical protein
VIPVEFAPTTLPVSPVRVAVTPSNKEAPVFFSTLFNEAKGGFMEDGTGSFGPCRPSQSSSANFSSQSRDNSWRDTNSNYGEPKEPASADLKAESAGESSRISVFQLPYASALQRTAALLTGNGPANHVAPVVFSAVLNDAKAGELQGKSEALVPTLLMRKASEKHLTERQRLIPDSQTVPVQIFPDQQLKPLQLRMTSALGHAEDKDDPSPIEEARVNTDQRSASDAVPQEAASSSPIAFSMNLPMAVTPDQKTHSPDHQNSDTTQPGQSAISSASVAGQTGDNNQSSDSDTHPSAEREYKSSEVKTASSDASRHDIGPAPLPGIQALPGSAGTATYSSASVELQKAPVSRIVNTQPAASIELTPMPAPASPRHIDLTVPNSDGHQVDVRISQRAGEVQVTVRTPDLSLAQSLRHHLPELSESLSRNGLSNEFFHSAQNASAETSHGKSQQETRHTPDDRNRPPAKRESKDRESVPFAQMINSKKKE